MNHCLLNEAGGNNTSVTNDLLMQNITTSALKSLDNVEVLGENLFVKAEVCLLL